MAEFERIGKRTVENPFAIVECDIVESVGFFALSEDICSGCRIPETIRAKGCIQIKTDGLFIVRIDCLIDEAEIVGRLVGELHCGPVAILEVECGYIFLPKNIAELGIILNIGLQRGIAYDRGILVDVACGSMQLPI